MNAFTAHQDTFARDNLPPREQWPDFINLETLGYPDKFNCTTLLLDQAIAEGHGDKPVIYTPSATWRYRELLEQANRIARVLVEGLKLIPGERVLLGSPNNAMMAACWFGIIRAGGIAVATMPLLRAKEISVIAEKAQVRLGLFDERLQNEVIGAQQQAPVLEQVVYFNGAGQLEALMATKTPEFTPLETSADDVCLIAFTSGTTGIPKGTVHFHRDILATCATVGRQVLKPTPDDIFIGSPPLAFTFGLGGLVLFPMYARAATVLLENATPGPLIDGILEYKATTVFTAPTAYRAILDGGRFEALASLRQCISAGETLPLPTFEAWCKATGIKIIDGLGSTEMLHIFITAANDDIRPGATGRPVPGYEARVVDEQGNTLPPGTVGRLAVRGPTGCRYLADKRQQQYVQNGWNFTGDSYKMDADGYFWFQARSDDMIISAGYNIAGPEVEDALLAHDAVAECAVVASPDERRGHIVKAFVALRPGFTGNDELVKTLQEHVKNSIAPYKYPRAIEFVEQLPRTQTGKIQRFKLRQLELERASSRG